MATRRRPAKKVAPKRTNSNIQAAQKAASDARKARVEKQQASSDRGEQKTTDAKLAAAQAAADPRRLLTKNTLQQNTRPGESKPSAPTLQGLPEAANKIAGLASGIMQQHQQEKRQLANPALYGGSDKERAARVTAIWAAQDKLRRDALMKTGNAVYMGPVAANAKLRNRGPQRQDENGGTTTQVGPVGDKIVTKDELISWLYDETNFNKIKTAAQKAGIAVESYDDVQKLWTKVVEDAAQAFSATGKKVTPWALLQLRGKTMKNGKPASKTTVSTSIDEMDPAEAKGMIRNAASQMLGRDPTKEEIEDFIAKAQTIAKTNPNVTTTTTNYGFDGEPVSQSSVSRGGGDAVTAQAQESAIEQSKQSEDYTAYQAAGVYMPWLMDALASPIN